MEPNPSVAPLLTPRRGPKRTDPTSEEALTPSRRSSRLSSLGADQQLQLAPDGGVIARPTQGELDSVQDSDLAFFCAERLTSNSC